MPSLGRDDRPREASSLPSARDSPAPFYERSAAYMPADGGGMTATDPQTSDEPTHGTGAWMAGPPRGDDSGPTGGSRPGLRTATWHDPLYGSVRVAGWAAGLLSTPPFARLAGISL